MSSIQFAISTHLYHAERLNRDHLVEIAAHRFEAIELFANRPHFDYADRASTRDLIDSLRDTQVRVHSVHAPVAAALVRGEWDTPLSLAASDPAARQRAIEETLAALRVASELDARYLVVHLGVPDAQRPSPGTNHADAVRRSLEAIGAAAGEARIRLALEVMPNALSKPERLVDLLEDELELNGAGICLDFGHAFLMGDLVDAIETASGHVVTTHVHDNHGRTDEHLVPFDGRIDWDAALMAVQKIGYDGAFVFELAHSDTPRQTLERTNQARARFEQLLVLQ